MSFLRGSANYVWCTTSVLGKGATGAVYQGVNKSNGEPVAVKTFNQLSHMRPQDVQMREFEVLKKVKHENIVKLLAIEEEQEGRGKVIVMELCTGGSLFNILDDPENTYGLEEKEFLLVLEHLTAGMKHLRDNNLVHRDLKPGNIMKFINDDGTTVYKLTDFGAARELQEGQQFVSLYGTEEYLHPDMYERAVLRKPVGKTFGATVDLWSIGVTLYHVATGNLPFRPYGGRRNKQTMFHITTKKASGVISGIQTKEDGPIEWGRELPTNCQLSTGLKKIVTPLLAGLLEADPARIWSFEKFFSEVTSLLMRKPVNIFYINSATNIKVFIHPDETYEQLQGYILEQTNIAPNHQILLFKQDLFVDVVGLNTRSGGYPTTTEEDPLIVFNEENNNIVPLPDLELPKFPEFPTLVSVENDASQAKLACSIGHICKRRVEKLSRSSNLIHKAAKYFMRFITFELKNLHTKCQHCIDLTVGHKETSSSLKMSQSIVTALQSSLLGSKLVITDYVEELSDISDSFTLVTDPKVQQLHQKNVVEDALKLEWDSSSRLIKCPFQILASSRARILIDRLRDSWQHLMRDRATRSLSYNDEQFHILERIKITETSRRIKELLESECVPSFSQLAENLGDWYKIAQTVYLQMTILSKDVISYEQKLEKFRENLSIECVQYYEEIKLLLGKIESGIQFPKSTNQLQGRKLKSSFQEANKLLQDISQALQENTSLIDQYELSLTKLQDMSKEATV
ncbi:hypothetical protein PPYR_04663 [Photinus pyralis]|uniref:Protein kinase domain-containing protein n=1 Tax=Photinus pyralis TaxID=7054 RepID=A0A1Y1N685_PHOPY|nr:inhibitor of nuclear factor kappa-B kinase subunit epsilon-like [Photinus pyralis]XP_031359432.1 inhibitor of nuclear factor kappa-B kinase subunit epsilon-like [Photinus pyralis]KAB0789972.1 hypothetical protein PPYR_15742 [Photinus pyralis]KAB0802477.1 hypothetical protein PPYR_04663 [Photinus pyralis]